MPNWTGKNFNELRDASPPGVPMKWRFARTALESPELGVTRFTYDPGARMPWEHRHHEQEEVYVVLDAVLTPLHRESGAIPMRESGHDGSPAETPPCRPKREPGRGGAAAVNAALGDEFAVAVRS
jgi:hypothetical protein